ncbi:hypothetical protein B0T14DRAFT_559351 [Immersiella caudata]|uniref:Uncharacterized protein n=1 Tax=Immersiella caudata TaxID=314043 RepID=A0AA39XCR9_9PEZI|nr:hypothetical protein B0T14DRAFT_559351 [Immersiella caudata]
MGLPRQHVRRAMGDRLLRVAQALVSVPLITSAFFLHAGTFQVQDSARPGAKRIGLSSLAIASLNSIIPSNETNDYLVSLRYFPNAFTYSYPSSPSAQTTSGILHSLVAHPAFDPYVLIQRLPSILALPPPETSCLSHNLTPNPETDASRCNPFWLAVKRVASSSWRFKYDPGFFGAVISVFIDYMPIPIIVLLYLYEIIVRYRPEWMRYRCRFAIMRRWCRFPKGTAEQVARIPASARIWDRLRCWWYRQAVIYCLLMVVKGTEAGYYSVRSLREFEGLLPEGRMVDARMRKGYLVLGWGGVVCAIIAYGCVAARWFLSTRWEQAEGEMGRGLLGGEEWVKDVLLG